MTCPDCTAAETTPRAYDYRADCQSCKARALAAIGAHLESAALGRQTAQYARALATMFGADGVAAGHESVKRWAKRMAAVDKRQGVRG